MKICTICGHLVFDSDWINHFRNGDLRHRLLYYSVVREIEMKEEFALMKG